MSDKIIKNKYECVFLLHAVGDTIGFKNSDWEFNYGRSASLETVLEFVFEFVDLGGINGINLKDWIVSDDTLYHIAIGNALVRYNEYKKLNDGFIKEVKLQLTDMHNRMFDEKEKQGFYRFPGITTTHALNTMSNEYDMRNEGYMKSGGGNGAAMRSLCIGLLFHSEKDFEQLVDMSITLAKLTHNAPIGFLAGFTSAYFVSLGIREVKVENWATLLITHLESPLIKKYVNTENTAEFLDYITYVNNWKIYLDTKFVDGRPLKTRSTSNMIFRLKYYQENFSKEFKNVDKIGSSGYCGMIMAYDSLLDCDGFWEKLVFYSMLHPGDSDTVGAIAGGLYGAVYGYGDVPPNMLEYLEEKKVLKKLGNTMYDQYYK
jgi:ADP-ribosylglycohydrolase